MTSDLEERIRRIEDRISIGETVIRYCVGVDRRDWVMFTDCFTDPVLTDYDLDDRPTGTVPRADLVARVAEALNGFTATQHLSPNHLITFDPGDPDRAVCESYMYAQHLLDGSPDGDYYLLRAAYTNHMLRTGDGWRIEGKSSDHRWSEGNENAVAEAIQRSRAVSSPPDHPE